MKRGGFLKRTTPLAAKSKSDTALIKEEIQHYLREIGLIRDGGCILRSVHNFDLPQCGGYRNDGQMIYQFDHFISRSNSATFSDPRLGGILCKAHHGWKSLGSNLRKARYDAILRTLLPHDRVVLWDKMEAESWKPAKMNWQLELAALKSEYNQYQRVPSNSTVILNPSH